MHRSPISWPDSKAEVFAGQPGADVEEGESQLGNQSGADTEVPATLVTSTNEDL